tara:strand:+ start:1961 stop:2236 length:276 start_codon:yes stop_codon:yes gene_type:complete
MANRTIRPEPIIDGFASLGRESLENMADQATVNDGSIDDLERHQNYSAVGRWAVYAFEELKARGEYHPAYREKMRQRAYRVCIAPLTDPNF